MSKVYRKYKGSEQCILIKVLEGDGTEESPMESMGYIHNMNGELLGVMDYRLIEDFNKVDTGKK